MPRETKAPDVPRSTMRGADLLPTGSLGLRSRKMRALLSGLGIAISNDESPVAVLGYSAAETLGITNVSGSDRVWLGGHWYNVVGILKPFVLAPEIDQAAIVSFESAGHLLGYNGHPSRIYVRAETE